MSAEAAEDRREVRDRVGPAPIPRAITSTSAIPSRFVIPRFSNARCSSAVKPDDDENDDAAAEEFDVDVALAAGIIGSPKVCAIISCSRRFNAAISFCFCLSR